MNWFSALEEGRGSLFTFLPRRDTPTRHRLQEGSRQTLNRLYLDFEHASLHNHKQKTSVVYKLPRLMYSVVVA